MDDFIRHPRYRQWVREQEEKERKEAEAKEWRERQARRLARANMTHEQAVSEFLPRVPGLVQSKTMQSKLETGRHCAEISLQKYVREVFEETYGIPFSILHVDYVRLIYDAVNRTYIKLKSARDFSR